MPSADGVTTVTQWRMTASTTTLKIVWDRGSPRVTHRYPLNRCPKYPPALDTMFSQSQYVQRSRTVLRPTPYAVRRSKSLSWSKVLYSFQISSKTLNNTTSLMAVSCWMILASRAAVPVPRSARKPCLVSCKEITVVSWRLKRLTIAFQTVDLYRFVCTNCTLE